MSDVKVTKSKTYFLPYINEYIPIKFLSRLATTYISYDNSYAFCLRYEYSGKKEFTEYERELENNKYYKFTIDINKKEVLYVFEIPEELFDTLDLFVSGKYSYLPNKEFLINYLRTNFGLPSDHKIIKIINRDDTLRYEIEEQLNVRIPIQNDLSSPPDLSDENYFISQKEYDENEKEYID